MTTLAERVAVLEQLPWVDPDLSAAMSTDKTDTGPTGGPPHRMTIYVPAHGNWTTVNFGAEHADRDYGNGIFMRTREHIQWQTGHSFMVMGGASTHIPTCADTVPGDNNGFAVVTEHDAYQHADGQHLLKSTGENMIFRTRAAKAAVLQSDAGKVEVNSGTTVQLNAANNILITADGGYSPATNTYSLDNGADWPPASAGHGVTKTISVIAKGVAVAATGARTIAAMAGSVESALQANKGVATAVSIAVGKAAANIGLYAAREEPLGLVDEQNGAVSGLCGVVE